MRSRVVCSFCLLCCLMKQCGIRNIAAVHFIFGSPCWPMLITYRSVLFPFLDDYLSWCDVLYCWRMMAELYVDLCYDLDVQMVAVAAVLRDCWFASHRAQNAWLDYSTDNTKANINRNEETKKKIEIIARDHFFSFFLSYDMRQKRIKCNKMRQHKRANRQNERKIEKPATQENYSKTARRDCRMEREKQF